MAVQATYSLCVDWDNDGSFATAGDDITAHMMTAAIRRGYSGPLARVPTVGRATFMLKNSGQDYSPELDADVLPLRPVRFQMTYGGTTKTLFRGFIEDIMPDSGTKRRRQCRLECVDAMALLDIYEGEIALQTDVFADDIVDAVVAAVYTPPASSYQAGKNLYPTSCDRWAWGEGASKGNRQVVAATEQIHATQKIMDACTGDWGRFFIAGDGTSKYYNRHQMPLDASTELTLTNTMVELAYRKAADTVYNYIEVTCNPRAVGETYEVLGAIKADDAPAIRAGETVTFVIQFRDAANVARHLGGKGCLTPVASTDFNCTPDVGGEGDNVNTDITPGATFYGDWAEITLENGGADICYVQKLQVRGYAVRAREPVTVVAQDATSIAAYGKRKLVLNVPMMSWTEHAQLLANHLLDVYKDPVREIRDVQFMANADATRMAAARDLDLMDKVVLTETQTGLSSNAGHIYWLAHDIESKWHHRVTMNLETAYSVGTPFRLDTSQLNSGHVLLY